MLPTYIGLVFTLLAHCSPALLCVADAMAQTNCFSALGGMNLMCSVRVFAYVKQFGMKGVMTTRYYHHFMSRMSLLDWN